MSLASYSDLQTQVGNWLARSDLTAYIPDMITLFEATAMRRLRVRLMETSTTLATSSGVATMPSDYLGFRRVTWMGTPNADLHYVAPALFADGYDGTAGTPQQYTIEGTSLRVSPVDDTGLSIVYYQRSPSVSSSLNWLYTNHPDAYLFGTLCEANAFMKGVTGFQNASVWKARRDEVFDEIQTATFRDRPAMAIRVQGNTP
jgi:hypothetical protein